MWKIKNEGEMLMSIKKLSLILIIFSVVTLVGCFGKYTVETVIDDEEVIDVSFEYNPTTFKEHTDVITSSNTQVNEADSIRLILSIVQIH